MTWPAAVEAAVIAHAREASPDECCGLLLGRGRDVLDAIPTPNTAGTPATRYLIDPTDHFHVIRQARQRRLDVVGVYHSHPRSTARPSATDAAEAFGEFVFLIVGLGIEPPEVAAWIWSEGNFVALPFVRLV